MRQWPLVGWLAERAGTLFFRRGSGGLKTLDRAMQERLTPGGSVLLFPEGTTTDGSDVRPFFPGCATPRSSPASGSRGWPSGTPAAGK